MREYLKNIQGMSHLLWLYFISIFLMGIGHGIFRVLRNQYIVDLDRITGSNLDGEYHTLHR